MRINLLEHAKPVAVQIFGVVCLTHSRKIKIDLEVGIQTINNLQCHCTKGSTVWHSGRVPTRSTKNLKFNSWSLKCYLDRTPVGLDSMSPW